MYNSSNKNIIQIYNYKNKNQIFVLQTLWVIAQENTYVTYVYVPNPWNSTMFLQKGRVRPTGVKWTNLCTKWAGLADVNQSQQVFRHVCFGCTGGCEKLLMRTLSLIGQFWTGFYSECVQDRNDGLNSTLTERADGLNHRGVLSWTWLKRQLPNSKWFKKQQTITMENDGFDSRNSITADTQHSMGFIVTSTWWVFMDLFYMSVKR